MSLSIVFFSIPTVFALQRSAIEQITSLYSGRLVVLRSELRAPSSGGEGMQTPMFDAKGWHFAAGSTVLRSGEEAEVTGVFNYAERGFFLELAAPAERGGPDALIDRQRARFRIMTDTPATDPSAQAAEALRLLDRLMSIVPSAP